MILGIPTRPGLRVVVASKPVDFRKGMDGLATVVTQALASDHSPATSSYSGPSALIA